MHLCAWLFSIKNYEAEQKAYKAIDARLNFGRGAAQP